jgi:aspartyl/asparaginyl beta-hydroxylase (cupin superfamily)
LYAVGGKADTIFVPLTNDLELEETAVLKQCPYVQEVIALFHFPKIAVRLMRLEVGAVIKPHRDHELGYEDGQFRLHIPIVTNPDVHFILDGEELTMRAGECWYTNVNYEHSVVNEGTEDRIHLVIDGVRNEWSDQLFFAEADPAQFVAPKAVMDPATIQRVIEELKRNGAAANSELIADLEKQLKPI